MLGIVDIGNTAVGPMPDVLAKYSSGCHLSESLQQLQGQGEEKEEVGGGILEQHLCERRAAVALVSAGGLLLHYVVLVGYNETTKALLMFDTNNTLEVISMHTLISKMDTYLGRHAILF